MDGASTLEHRSLLDSCRRTCMKHNGLPTIPSKFDPSSSWCSTRASSRPSSGGSELDDSRTPSICVNTERFFEACHKVQEPKSNKPQKTRPIGGARSISAARRGSDSHTHRSSSTSKGRSSIQVPGHRQKAVHDALPLLPWQKAAVRDKADEESFEKKLLELSRAAGVDPPKAGTSLDPLMSRSPSSPELKRSGRLHSKLYRLHVA
mmetsp:Transcript_69344/g.130829  ORF Transcript_69344/g.130829 Transcript_69344/m.130829 type:complete len:206 (+) Transcript_69344:90-707(+)